MGGPVLLSCFWNFWRYKYIHSQVWPDGHGAPSTLLRTTDTNLDCVFAEKTVILLDSKIEEEAGSSCPPPPQDTMCCEKVLGENIVIEQTCVSPETRITILFRA